MDVMNSEIKRDVLMCGANLVGFADVTMLPGKVTAGLPRAVSIFETGEPINTSRCGDCRKCVDQCPAGAINGSNWSLGVRRESMYDAFVCWDTAKRLAGRQGIEATICGVCINVCPWTQKYILRESST
jgi:NAD-dependent dihydropyrimidine dehydrogenase PreA subunit